MGGHAGSAAPLKCHIGRTEIERERAALAYRDTNGTECLGTAAFLGSERNKRREVAGKHKTPAKSS